MRKTFHKFQKEVKTAKKISLRMIKAGKPVIRK